MLSHCTGAVTWHEVVARWHEVILVRACRVHMPCAWRVHMPCAWRAHVHVHVHVHVCACGPSHIDPLLMVAISVSRPAFTSRGQGQRAQGGPTERRAVCADKVIKDPGTQAPWVRPLGFVSDPLARTPYC